MLSDRYDLGTSEIGNRLPDWSIIAQKIGYAMGWCHPGAGILGNLGIFSDTDGEDGRDGGFWAWIKRLAPGSVGCASRIAVRTVRARAAIAVAAALNSKTVIIIPAQSVPAVTSRLAVAKAMPRGVCGCAAGFYISGLGWVMQPLCRGE